MRLKQVPEDFRVVERLRDGVLGSAGPHAVYRVEKRERSTIEAAMRLAQAAGVKLDAVRFCGLKDRRAVASQHFSIEGGPPLAIDEPGFAARCVGRAIEPARAAWIDRNDFGIGVGDLDARDLAALAENLPAVREEGLPNYFDDQRFGAARAGKGFPLRELLRGNAEEAARLFLATPGSNDPPAVRARKEAFAGAWGDFAACASLAARRHERAAFEHLASRPDDFPGALRFVPRRERLIQAMAFQAWIWNRCADRLVGETVAAERTGSVPTDLGPLRFWRVPAEAERGRIRALNLPLVGPTLGGVDATIRAAIDETLAAEGLSIARLRDPGVRGLALRVAERTFVLRPLALETEADAPDPEAPGRRRARLALSLPRGAYATLVVRRLFA